MSTHSGDKKTKGSSNSTRLPPRTNIARRPPGNHSKGRKAILEKEAKQMDQEKEKLESCAERLIKVLENGGVPKEPW